MTPSELKTIKDRISKTICETWRGDHDGAGNMICVIEGRISADDFMALFAEIERPPVNWQPIETAPIDQPVLLFCPDLGCGTNRSRIELCVAHSSRGSHHSWATHWMPLPKPPEKQD